MTKFRVWWIAQIPGPVFRSEEVTNFAAAVAIHDTLARYDIFQLQNRIKPDFANMGGIERWDENDQKWYNVDDAQEIDDDEQENK
jgi:hypothetical protein